MQALFLEPAYASPPLPLCDWNRLSLPASFAGVVGHGFEALVHSCSSPEEIAQGLRAMERCAISDVLLSPDDLDSTRHLLQLLGEHSPTIRPWLSLSAASSADPRSWQALAELHPYCGLNLSLDLATCNHHEHLHTELQRLRGWITQASVRRHALRLVLRHSAAATPEQLQSCMAFALEQDLLRLTLSDDDSKLTPLGVRNIFAVLSRSAPQQLASTLRLEFLAGNARGHALANAIAALDGGANYIHGTLAGCTEHDQPSPLVALLEHFALPRSQQLGLDSYRDFLSQHHGLALRPLGEPGQSPAVRQEPGRYAIAMPPNGDALRFVFRVSSDDWHVRLCIETGETELDLGERVHHYVLLLLAREYCQQQRSLVQQKSLRPEEIDPLSLGWLEREELHRMIGDSEAQFNVKLCRALKQICSAVQTIGLDNYRPVSTRVGSIRLDCANFTIYKDSKVEAEVRNWLLQAQ